MPSPLLRLLSAGSLAAALVVSVPSAAAQPKDRADTPSGFPVPRFVSFRHDGTNCRTGPSLQHPIAATYTRAGTPVLVIAETPHDNWRKIRDVDGATCWTHQATIEARTHVILLRDAALRARPAEETPVRARLSRGSLVRYEKSAGAWTRVVAGPVGGFVETSALWGVEPDVAPR